MESLELLLCASDSGTKAKRGASPGVPAGVDGASRRNGRAWVTAVGRCGSTRDTTCNVPNTRIGNRCTGPLLGQDSTATCPERSPLSASAPLMSRLGESRRGVHGLVDDEGLRCHPSPEVRLRRSRSQRVRCHGVTSHAPQVISEWLYL